MRAQDERSHGGVTPQQDEAAPAAAPQDTSPQSRLLQRKMQQRALQRRSQGGGAGDESMHDAAQAGVAGGSSALPHLDRIQESFGGHDVSGVAAHVGGPAAAASDAIGASAYAVGNHVAFREAPDLHTAAHEAAHVVQQRAGVHLKGGIGQEGDSYEQHADAVADLVVAGKSAESLLGQMSGGGGGSAIQRKPRDERNTIKPTDPKQGTKSPGVLEHPDKSLNERIKFGPLRNQCATWMEAEIHPTDELTLKGGDEPQEGTWPSWWEKAAPVPNNFWVRGHLLNHNLGGPGEMRNLTPITQGTNRAHAVKVERFAKDEIEKGHSIRYKVSVNYGSGPSFKPQAGRDPKADVWKFLASSMDCTLEVLDEHGKTLKTLNVNIPNDHA